MAALATLEQLEDRMGSIADPTRAQAFLDDASILVIDEAGTDWSGAGEEVPLVVAVIVLAATARALRNPDGAESEKIGATYAVTYQRTLGGVWLTRAECRRIRRAAGQNSIGSIELESPYAAPDVITVPVDTNGDLRGDELPWVTIGDEDAY